MRIVGGKYKGRVLAEFKGEEIRPTADNVRESLFNILGERIIDSAFLDLFCGTGAVGIEALSRGAGKVVFNDGSERSSEITKKNLSVLGISSARVSVREGVSFLNETSEKFDFIYIDPPYKSDSGFLAINAASRALNAGGIAVLEGEKPFTGVAKGVILKDIRKYGRVFLNFFEKAEDKYAVYAGTFDPVTKGHINCVENALKIFGKVIVTVGTNPQKTPVFSREKRIDFLHKAFENYNGVTVIDYAGFAGQKEYAEFLLKNGAKYYVRGVRNAEDFAYEKKAERVNSVIYPEIKTAYIICEKPFSEISASRVRKNLLKGKDVKDYLPEACYKEIISAFKNKNLNKGNVPENK